MIYIGIDPGIHTGVAVWDSKQRIIREIKTMNFWDTIALINNYRIHTPTVVIEDPSGNKPVFVKDLVGQHKALTKKAQNVGSNKREATLLIEYCEREGFRVLPVVPVKKRGAKVSADHFKKLTGYVKSTSQHARDAALLVYGK
jgi:hypothetical protein